MYFERPGRDNTPAAVAAAVERARELGITRFVVASNTGYTIRQLLGQGVPGERIVGVTHHIGFREPGGDEMEKDERRKLDELGVTLLTTTHLFGNVERAVTNKFGGLYPGGLIAQALKLLGEGTKVCVECSVMAMDAGLVAPGEELVAIGGSSGGADTAVVIVPAHARDFFDTEVREIICKPRRRK